MAQRIIAIKFSQKTTKFHFKNIFLAQKMKKLQGF